MGLGLGLGLGLNKKEEEAALGLFFYLMNRRGLRELGEDCFGSKILVKAKFKWKLKPRSGFRKNDKGFGVLGTIIRIFFVWDVLIWNVQKLLNL